MSKNALKILTFPIWFPLYALVLLLISVLSLVLIATGFAIVLLSVFLFVLGIFVVFVSLTVVSQDIFTSILGFGFSAILFGIGIIIGIFGLWICTRCIPSVFNWLKSVTRKLFPSRSKTLVEKSPEKEINAQ